MRIKVAVTVGLMLALTSSAWALSLGTGARFFYAANWDMSNGYMVTAAGQANIGTTAVNLQTAISNGWVTPLAAADGPDGWGVFKVNSIWTEENEGGVRLYDYPTNATKLQGFFWNIQDDLANSTVLFNGSAYEFSVVTLAGSTNGMKFELYEAPGGVADPPVYVNGPAGDRIGNSYTGWAGNVAGANLVLSGFADSFATQFSVNSLGNVTTGSTQMFLSVDGNALADWNQTWDTNAFNSGVSDLELAWQLYNTGNLRGFSLRSTDEGKAVIIPEPVTFLTCGLAIAGLGRYVRRRTSVQA